MALKNMVVERHTIKFGQNEIVVRGLSTNDVLAVLYQNKDSLETLLKLATEAGVTHTAELPDDGALMGLVANAVVTAPFAVASVIAYACDEPDALDAALSLPAPVQIEALVEITRLTFTDRAGFERFVGNVMAAIGAAKALAPSKRMTAAA